MPIDFELWRETHDKVFCGFRHAEYAWEEDLKEVRRLFKETDEKSFRKRCKKLIDYYRKRKHGGDNS